MSHEKRKPSVQLTLDKSLFNKLVSILELNSQANINDENLSSIAEKLKKKMLTYSVPRINDITRIAIAHTPLAIAEPKANFLPFLLASNLCIKLNFCCPSSLERFGTNSDLIINNLGFSVTFEFVNHHIINLINNLTTTYETNVEIVIAIGSNLTWLIEIKIVTTLTKSEATNVSKALKEVDLNASTFAFGALLPL